MPATLTPLRYPGGKTKLYSYVKDVLAHNYLIGQTYVEPFAGGAGLAIKLLLNGDVSKIVINDYDPAIFSFWFCVLNRTDELCRIIQDTDITTTEWHRQKDIYLSQDIENCLELGFATLFLNRTNVSGVIKGGIVGGLNQMGNYSIDARFNKNTLIKKIHNIAKVKKNIELYNLDVNDLLDFLTEGYDGAFIYFDPPYVNKGAKLYENSFNETDHITLANNIFNCRNKWIVTYDICDLISGLYKDYRCSLLEIKYSIQKSKDAKEFIFFSNNLLIPEGINLSVPCNICNI